jgi:two-component system phosphate regulon response regulator PhoB
MPKTILVIEDDLDILDMMIYILKDEGYDVTGSTDCLSLDKVLQIQPDLILMDNRLRDSSGKDECRKLKEDAATADIPVILVSANQYLSQLAAESFADGYISKPFDLEELISTVRLFA